VVVAGTRSEADLAHSVSQGLGDRVSSCAGLLNLQELAGLLSMARIFVGNDSGTGHVAGALGIPTISLHVQPKTADAHHISAPEHYKPVGPQVTVLQPDDFLAPCHNRCEASSVHCLDQITVEEVWSAFTIYCPIESPPAVTSDYERASL
jgi:ADP-heptose:LPS heptosyltransferase